MPDFIKRVKGGEGRLMGFGHRVYKSYDPRAKIIKRIADLVFEVTGKNPLLDIALELERIALEDDYFVSRKLYPNVDFYSGLIYQAMGFPVEMFPVLFAIPRTAGWIAQWEEMLTDPEQKIARPRQVYVGFDRRDYVPRDTKLTGLPTPCARPDSVTGPHRRSRLCWRPGCGLVRRAAPPAATAALRRRRARSSDLRQLVAIGPRVGRHRRARSRRAPTSRSSSRPPASRSRSSRSTRTTPRGRVHMVNIRAASAGSRRDALQVTGRASSSAATTTPSCSGSSRSSAPTTAARAPRS